jgi:hypothetical protein
MCVSARVYRHVYRCIFSTHCSVRVRACACTHVCGYVRTRCAHRCRCVCVPRQMPRVSMGARVSLAIRLSKVCVCGHPTIFGIHETSVRHRDARVGVRLWRLRARVRPRGLHQPQGTIAEPNASVCVSRACGCVCACMRDLICMVSARSAPRLSIGARRAQPHARAVRGRDISFTKVQALPESLGQCKLLVELCVRTAAPPPPGARAWRCGCCASAARVKRRISLHIVWIHLDVCPSLLSL